MNAFMVPAAQKTSTALPDDNMPDGHGIDGGTPTDAGQQPRQYPSFCFEHASRNSDRAAGDYDKKNEHNADA